MTNKQDNLRQPVFRISSFGPARAGSDFVPLGGRISDFRLRWPVFSLVLTLASGFGCGPPGAFGVTVSGVQYQQDQQFPEYECYWHSRLYPGPCGTAVNGANAHVYLKNTGASSVTISDVTLAGRGLNHDIKQITQGANYPSSIYYANLSSSELQTLVNAGEPVWYKADPATIPAGGVAQVIVRLRYIPTTQPISIGVVTSAGTVTATIPVDAAQPQLASVGFSSDLTKVYLHWRRSGGAAPASVWMDGNDLTASTTTVGDSAVNFGASVIQLAAPLSAMSYHVFQGVYSDGKTATAGLRAWVNPFLYGTWAAKPTSSGAAAGQAWVNEATAHGVNVCVMNIASDGLADLISTPSGQQWCQDHGYGVVKDDTSSASQILRMWFIRDEPDGADANMTGLPPGRGHNPGVLAMWGIDQGEPLRAAYSLAPTTVNIDGNLKPYNYWNWGQVPDVFMTDPYYQPLLSDAYWYNNSRIPLYQNALEVYATAQTAALACEPNPLHVILFSNKQKNSDTGAVWPFPTPQSKRIEAYYALAGGAKGLAYWWYKNPDGLGAGTSDALALWKEIGLLGNEIKTAQPMLVTSHPVTLTTSATSGVWVRTLAAGNDTMLFLVVNNQYYNDISGCHYTPVNNATVTATLPAWLIPPSGTTAFEITPGGLYDVNAVVNGTQVQLNLGTLNLTRMIVLTSNPQLRGAIQTRYTQSVWPGVCSFAPEYCTPQSVPPSITQQPSSATVVPLSGTSFAVVASGTSPLYYQWQKNNANLANGGHYSGCTTATLAISSAATNDQAGYRCVVTNAYGSVTSAVATLTVTASIPCSTILNSGFENGFTLYGGSNIGNDWTQWEAVAGTITGYDEVTNIHSSAHSQRIRLWNTAGGTSYAAVYQRVATPPGSSYTISVWMYAYDTNSYCYLGVDPTGGTNPASADVVWTTGYNSQAWVQKSSTGTSPTNYVTVFCRVRSTDTNKRNGYFDDAVFACPPVNVPPSITQSPQDRTVLPGASTSFSVEAIGSDPLSFQWQRDGLNLANGGNISGCTTPTLEINGAEFEDEAGYRCVVTNLYGSATSSPAVLTVTGDCPSGTLLNADFEGGNTGGVATGWIPYQRGSPAPTTVWSIQTAGPPTGGGLQYQQIANTSSATSGGGVRQDVTGCMIGATYIVSGWMRGNSASATCRVKCSPSASTNWATAIDLNPPQFVSTNNWVPFSGTVVATGPSMTIWLDGQTGGSGLNKAECFDSVTVTCTGVPAPLLFESATMASPQKPRLVLSGPEGGAVTIQRSSNLVNWVSITNLINSNGTLQFTDAPPANTFQRYYRATSP